MADDAVPTGGWAAAERLASEERARWARMVTAASVGAVTSLLVLGWLATAPEGQWTFTTWSPDRIAEEAPDLSLIHQLVDVALAGLYSATALLAAWCIGWRVDEEGLVAEARLAAASTTRRLGPARRSARRGATLVVGATVADWAEDGLGWFVVRDRSNEALIDLLLASAWLKWTFLAVGFGLLAWATASAVARLGRSTRRSPLEDAGDAQPGLSQVAADVPPPDLASSQAATASALGLANAQAVGTADRLDPRWPTQEFWPLTKEAETGGKAEEQEQRRKGEEQASAPRDRIGVCLSGGGIRSAAFSLGALQAISTSELGHIRYVTAASGGGYTGAAWAAETAREPDQVPFAPGSEAERHVRNHSDFLVSSPKALFGAVVTLLGGMAFNLVLVLLVLAAACRPVGWAVGRAHPELRARLPLVEVDGSTRLEVSTRVLSAIPDPSDQVAGILRLSASEADRLGACAACPEGWRRVPIYAVYPAWADGPPQLLTSDEVARLPDGRWASAARDDAAADALRQAEADGLGPRATARAIRAAEDRAGRAADVAPGVVVDLDTRLVVLRQPTVAVPPAAERILEVASDGEPADGDPDEHRSLRVARQPHVEARRLVPRVLDLAPVDDADPLDADEVARAAAQADVDRIARALAFDEQPVLRQRSGTVGQADLDLPGWAWLAVGIGLAATVGAALLDRKVFRFPLQAQHVVSGALLTGTAALFTVLLGLPLLVRGLPALVEHLPGHDSLASGWAALLSGVAATASLLWKFGRSAWSAGSGARSTRFWRHIPDLVLGVVVLGVVLAASSYLLGISAANGPRGRLAGLFDDVGGQPDGVRWIVGLVVLGLLSFLPSMFWSLQAFYRDRLSVAFLRPGAPRGDRQKRDRPTGPGPMQLNLGRGPDTVERGRSEITTASLVVCTTVNLRNAGVAAPGRGAGSFTFSPEWVGGPDVGWMPTDTYVGRLADGRRRDVSAASLMTISGAAFSPAMGKDSKGWQGRVMAVANLRLGSWIASPAALLRRKAGRDHFGRLTPPGVTWFLREVLGRYDVSARYLYLTDGGHWDNLGLVELFRRGCTDIWMVSAAGDGIRSFETLAQALALAREHLQVEVADADLDALRPPLEVADGPHRLLLRDGEDTPTAAEGHVATTFWYPPATPGGARREGRLHIIEAALLGDLPWDVHAYAEANPDFPDISTGYQLMDHRDFEAYRTAGYVQTVRALHHAHAGHDGNPVLAPVPTPTKPPAPEELVVHLVDP